MASIVTTRFIECLDLLKERNHVPSDRKFALALDFYPQSLNEIRKGKRNVTIELVNKAVEVFDFNADYLFSGRGSCFSEEVDIINENSQVLTVVLDKDQKEQIVHVPIAAQAGYGGHLHNPVFFEQLTSFSLPGQQFQSRTQRCFDVSGDSMEPVISSGDKIICSFMEPENWVTNVRTGMVYIVVTKEEILVKRLVNNLREEAQIICQSDNPIYDDRVIDATDVLELWIVKQKISTFSHAACGKHEAMANDMNHMQQTVCQQSELIKNLNDTIEKLLRQTRLQA